MKLTSSGAKPAEQLLRSPRRLVINALGRALDVPMFDDAIEP